MPNPFPTTPRVAALGVEADGTNEGCHGNINGVDANDKAILAHVQVMVLCWGKFYEQPSELC